MKLLLYSLRGRISCLLHRKARLTKTVRAFIASLCVRRRNPVERVDGLKRRTQQKGERQPDCWVRTAGLDDWCWIGAVWLDRTVPVPTWIYWQIPDSEKTRSLRNAIMISAQDLYIGLRLSAVRKYIRVLRRSWADDDIINWKCTAALSAPRISLPTVLWHSKAGRFTNA